VLRCPNGIVPDSQLEELVSAPEFQFMAPARKRRILRSVPAYALDRSWTGYWYTSNYSINSNAGSFFFYHDNTVNQGLYPRREWRHQPSSVGYLFESNMWQTGGGHMVAAYDPVADPWDYGVPWSPTSPHYGLERSNMICADG